MNLELKGPWCRMGVEHEKGPKNLSHPFPPVRKDIARGPAQGFQCWSSAGGRGESSKLST